MAALRHQCPWDREQTLQTLEHYLLEETYELLEAMRSDDPDLHCEELGDLLFQVVFQAQIRADERSFDLADVVDRISDKLVRRHPHVFGDEQATRPEEVARRWEELKQAEGKGGLEGVPRTLPALMRAEKLGQRAARVGFDWPDLQGPLAKVTEELGELRQAIAAGDRLGTHHELGDLLFAAVNVARHLEVHPEDALRDANARFESRLARVRELSEESGRGLGELSLQELDAFWEQAKREAKP
jgi:MazG family protein